NTARARISVYPAPAAGPARRRFSCRNFRDRAKKSPCSLSGIRNQSRRIIATAPANLNGHWPLGSVCRYNLPPRPWRKEMFRTLTVFVAVGTLILTASCADEPKKEEAAPAPAAEPAPKVEGPHYELTKED